MIPSTAFAYILAASAVAACGPLPVRTPAAGDISASLLESIAPGTKSCPDGADFAYECRTAEEAAPYISKSFTDYKIESAGEKAALISLMLYESGEFKYNRNHFPAPGNPGQGTRNMQSPEFNEEYAASLFSADKISKAKAKGGVDGVLGLLRPDKYAFGSAAWFLTTQCDDATRKGLSGGSVDAWKNYITGCIGTTVDGDRLALYQKSLKALQ